MTPNSAASTRASPDEASRAKSRPGNAGVRFPLRLKFTLGSIAILFGVSLILLTYFSKQMEHQALDLIEKRVENMAETVGLGVAIALSSNNFQAIHDILTWARKDQNLAYILVYAPDGHEIAHLPSEYASIDVKALLNQEGPARYGKTLSITTPIRYSRVPYGKLVLGYSLEDMYNNIFNNLVRGILLCVGVLALGAVLTVVVSGVITRNIRELWTAVDDFTRGRENAPIPISSSDEIGELSAAFNHMTETIRRNIQSLKDTNLLLGREIGERRTAEEKLRRSRRQLRNLTNRVQSVREEEKINIAREIHDELGQTLSALNMDLAWLEGRIQDPDPAISLKIETMSETVENIVNRVHQIITHLRPQMLDVLGICDALQWQTREFQKRTGIECDLFIDPEKMQVDPERSIALFRIYQESLTNVARHAHARSVKARFEKQADHIALEVRDDGVGISRDHIVGESSFGLLGIRERALVFGGRVTISGAPGEGTTLKVEIPVSGNGDGN